MAHRTRHALQARKEADVELAALAQRPAQSGGARLFHRAARALTALETLPALREDICRQTLDVPAAISGFRAVIRQLLGLIFDAADAATEPAVSRAMIALFSFMQGKELAVQERALGGGFRPWDVWRRRASATHDVDRRPKPVFRHL